MLCAICCTRQVSFDWYELTVHPVLQKYGRAACEFVWLLAKAWVLCLVCPSQRELAPSSALLNEASSALERTELQERTQAIASFLASPAAGETYDRVKGFPKHTHRFAKQRT